MSGIEGTISSLDRVGVKHSGMARSKEEAMKINMIDVYNFKVAHLSYTYGLNGGDLKPGFEYQANIIDKEKILEEARRAKNQGADFVVLSMHWGSEYIQKPSLYQKELAISIMESDDIDLIVGHHAHIIQPIDIVNDKYVVYGLGNFCQHRLRKDVIALWEWKMELYYM